MVCPHIRDIYVLIHIFIYITNHFKLAFVFDLCHPSIDETRFISCDREDIYPQVFKNLPEYLPISLGNKILSTCFVDIRYANDLKKAYVSNWSHDILE